MFIQMKRRMNITLIDDHLGNDESPSVWSTDTALNLRYLAMNSIICEKG